MRHFALHPFTSSVRHSRIIWERVDLRPSRLFHYSWSLPLNKMQHNQPLLLSRDVRLMLVHLVMIVKLITMQMSWSICYYDAMFATLLVFWTKKMRLSTTIYGAAPHPVKQCRVPPFLVQNGRRSVRLSKCAATY